MRDDGSLYTYPKHIAEKAREIKPRSLPGYDSEVKRQIMIQRFPRFEDIDNAIGQTVLENDTTQSA